jgi:hypothetical protein
MSEMTADGYTLFCGLSMSICRTTQVTYDLLLNQQFVAIYLQQDMVNRGLSSAGAESTDMPRCVQRQESSATVEK